MPRTAAEPAPEPKAPPIPLKFYGFVNKTKVGDKRAFFLDGEDIVIAGEGDMIKKRYKIVRIGVNSAVVEDTEFKTNNQQTLPLEAEWRMNRADETSAARSGLRCCLVFVMAAAIAITLYMEVPRVAFESQRAKEQMAIDRGLQYERAIQLFYRKYQTLSANPGRSGDHSQYPLPAPPLFGSR